MSQTAGGVFIKFSPLEIQVVDDSARFYVNLLDNLSEETFTLQFNPNLIIWSSEFNTMVKLNGNSTYYMDDEELCKILDTNQVPYNYSSCNEFTIKGYNFILSNK